MTSEPRLWYFDELRAAHRAAPTGWYTRATEAFEATLLDRREPYPCDFGVRAQRAGHNSVTVFEAGGGGRYGVATLAATLRAFAGRASTGPARQSLVVFTEPDGPGLARLDRYHNSLWTVLRELAADDRAPWPPGVPPDPADPRWQWSFAGEPWFVFALGPAYRTRRSRAVGTGLTLVFQTGRVFTGLGGATGPGRRAKRRIRQRLLAYDALPPHPYLGDAEHSSAYKWRQYLLPDDQSVLPADRCPFTGPAPA